MTKKKSILNICLALNLAQLFISGCSSVLRNFGLLDNLLVKTSMFALQIFVWILLTMNIFVKRDIKNKSGGIVVGIMSVLPAVVMTVAAVLISHFGDSNSAGWVTFSFLGSSLSFYNKSGIILTDYIPVADAYLIFCANYAVMIVCSAVGGFLGASSNRSLDKKKPENKQEKNEELNVTRMLDDLEKKESAEEYSSEEDAELTDVVLDEAYAEEDDDSTVATVISMPADDEDEESDDEEEETLHEAISIISVDVDELEDEAEDMFRKRYDDMNIDNDFDAMKAEADGLLEIASEINNNIDGIIVELDTILQSDKVYEKVLSSGKQDEIDAAIAEVYEEVYEAGSAGTEPENMKESVTTAVTAEEIAIDECEIIIGDEDIIQADEIFEEVVSEYTDEIDITEIELAEDEVIEVEGEIINIFGEDEETEEYIPDVEQEESVEGNILTEAQERKSAEDMSIDESVLEEAEETTAKICEIQAEQDVVVTDTETMETQQEEPVSEEKTLEQEILADEVSIDDIVFEDEVTQEDTEEKEVDPEVAALVKELEEKRLAQRRKKQKEQDFDNWLNRRTTRIDTNEIREVLRKAGISDNEEK